MCSLRQRFLGLCVTPIVFEVFDSGLTLAGQSSAYWAGDHTQVNEASPTLHYLLTVHPLAFVVGTLVWMAVFVGILLLLTDTLALIVSIAVTLGHAAGAATWIIWQSKYGYQACNGLFLLTAVSIGLGIRWGWGAGPPQEYRLSIGLARWRWVLCAALFAIGVYLFLWPRSV